MVGEVDVQCKVLELNSLLKLHPACNICAQHTPWLITEDHSFPWAHDQNGQTPLYFSSHSLPQGWVTDNVCYLLISLLFVLFGNWFPGVADKTVRMLVSGHGIHIIKPDSKKPAQP